MQGTYLSFWPDSEAGKRDLKAKRSHDGSLMEYIEDGIRAEDMVLPKTYEIRGLDEEAIIRYTRGIQSNLPRYQIARNNCSHVVGGDLTFDCKA